ncbi:MAG TPA: penicillin-binding protein 2 [Polyangia bacterium]
MTERSRLTPRAKGTHAPPRRFAWAQVAVAGCFLVLVGRLYQLQVMSGDYYMRKSADNFVKELELPATRGQIRDHKGRVLVDNRPAYDVYITPRFFNTDALTKLKKYLALSDDQATALEVKISAKRGLDRFRQFVAFEDISRDEMALLESEKNDLPGVAVQAVAHRNYPHGALAAHVLGYMNQITPEELADKRQRADTLNYHLGDYVGRAGLERQWESFLRGKDGVERIVVDAKGQRKDGAELDSWLGGPQRSEPEPGNDLVTSIDLDLQEHVEAALARHKSGAAAVVEVDTGRVLALASWPEPDPNVLTGRLTRTEAAALNDDPLRPMMDKALRENYFPGSTFKIVPSIAALEEHLVDPEAIVTCHGGLRFGKRMFHCAETHGKLNLHFALAESCDVYYYELGQTLGLDRMARVAHDLGFGEPTGLGLNAESPGLVPSMDFYKRMPGGFQKGFLLNTAIGQGDTKATVLQVAMAYAALANGGKLWVPQIVERVQSPDGRTVQAFEPRLRRQIAASADTLQKVRAALYDAVNHPKGTSWAARVPGLEVAGKTGTAQTGKNHKEGAEGDENNSHSWFASFAPYSKPEIAVVVLIEHGGFGAKASTPTAMEIYEGYFHKPHYEPPKKKRAPAAGEPAAEPEPEPETAAKAAQPQTAAAANGEWP